MKSLTLILFCIAGFFSVQGQHNYKQALQQGDEAFNKQQYKIAINKYFAAEAFDPTKKEMVKDRVNKAFDKIEALRVEAINSKNEAFKQKSRAEKALEEAGKQTRIATANYLVSEAKGMEKTDPTLALRLAEQAMRYHNSNVIQQTAQSIYSENIFYKIIGKATPKYDEDSFGDDQNLSMICSDKETFLYRDTAGIHVINLLTKKQQESHMRIQSDAQVVFSTNGNILVSNKTENGYNNSVFDKEFKKLGAFISDTTYLTIFSPDSQHLVAYNQSGQFQFLDYNGNVQKEITIPNTYGLDGFALSESGFFLFTYKFRGWSITPGKTNWDIDLNLWNDRGDQMTKFKNNIKTPFQSASFLPGNLILLNMYDNSLDIIDLDGNFVNHLAGHSASVLSISLSEDKQSILTFSKDSTFREWEFKKKNTREPGLGWINRPSVKFSPDGLYYFVNYDEMPGDTLFHKMPGYAGNDISIDMEADIPEPKEIADNGLFKFEHASDYSPDLIKSNNKIKAYCFFQDRQSVILGMSGETIIKQDLNGLLLQDYKIPWDEHMTSIAFASDEKFIMTGNTDGSVIIWNKNGEKQSVMKSHSAEVTGIVISPDHKYFITMGGTQAKLWQIEDGLLLYTYQEIYHPDLAWYSPNGKYVLIKLNEAGTMLLIPPLLKDFLKSGNIEPLSADQKRQYGIK